MKFIKFALKTLLEQEGFYIGVVFVYGLLLTFAFDLVFGALSHKLWGWEHNWPLLSLSWFLIWMIGLGVLVVLVVYHEYRVEEDGDNDTHNPT